MPVIDRVEGERDQTGCWEPHGSQGSLRIPCVRCGWGCPEAERNHPLVRAMFVEEAPTNCVNCGWGGELPSEHLARDPDDPALYERPR